MRHFLDAILLAKAAKTDGWNGREVVRVLEAADYSLHNGCGEIELEVCERARFLPARATVGSPR